jgi:hypothetical protein
MKSSVLGGTWLVQSIHGHVIVVGAKKSIYEFETRQDMKLLAK